MRHHVHTITYLHPSKMLGMHFSAGATSALSEGNRVPKMPKVQSACTKDQMGQGVQPSL